jgi:thiol-disulfide isomerase/thioredoxin
MSIAKKTAPISVRTLMVVALVIIGACFVSRSASPWFAGQGAASTNENPFSRRIPAPEIDGGVQWVNTNEALTLSKLRGRFVLLDFWTYCCINCMHVLPELKKLEQAYPTELVVIGVHSAKFEGEKDSQNILEAIFRYEIEHPVVNDARMQIWDKFGVRSWPTMVLIDPAGEVVWAGSGEHTFEQLKAILDRGLPYYRAQGLLKPAPRPKLIADAAKDGPLRFPGKVFADEAGRRLFITDSNHNRIVVVDFDGRLQFVIGSGAIGRADGAFDDAAFNHPQGTALAGDHLYVSDTENHLLRKVDLVARQVTTVSGTGEKGVAWPAGNQPEGASRFQIPGGVRTRYVGPPKTTALASPWAVWPHEGALYIAMAGPHQIWKMPLTESEIGPYAGNGREAIDDGPLLPRIPYDPGFASFAQPSGLASDGRRLFVADSEGSIIRSVPFDPNGQVESVVGPTGASLFEFGDRDGTGEQVRLQHPLGVAWHGGKLYVADTYNNKIKVVEVAKRTCRTLAGTGKPGREDGDGVRAMFNEPGGLCGAGDKLFVADTNNHAIRVVELAAPNRVTTLAIQGFELPK